MFRLAGQGLFSVLFPSNCRLCESPLAEVSRLPVCSACLAAIEPIQGALCSLCGERIMSMPLSSAQAAARCGNCERMERPFEKAVAYGVYDSGMRELIHLLKYDRIRPAAKVLGRMLGEVIASLYGQFPSELFENAPLVIPVPLHSSRLRQRGFNHSELIAACALKSTPPAMRLEFGPKILVRARATESQTGLTESQRRANLRGAFRLQDRQAIAGRDILLVDDVYTTGTTASECSRVLRAGGARRVWVATVARVLKSSISSQQFSGPLPERLPEEEEGGPSRARAAGA
ncbi:MAG TPA: ComF family protein [Terriglobales bacterium]|jgi:ComF family protein|nr:ComF family protein [Terriglobales bacterium]